MKLTALDIGSPLWEKLVDHYTPILAKLRARVENPAVPEAERLGLCFRIREIRDLFELAEPDRKAGDQR